MKINFINSSYRRFFSKHEKEIMGAFKRCASKGDFMLREETRRFEKKLAKYVGVKYAVGTNSCTDAMFLSLLALGIGKGDEVITVGHTFIATIQSIVHTGATPILIDVKDNECMDIDQIIPAITKRTKAILPVHFHGKVCNMSAIMAIARTYDLKVVEDAAQALGASHEGKRAGSFGDTGCFSFNAPKLMGAYGDAGAVVTDNEELYKKILLLRNHWNITQGSVRQADYPQPEVMGWGWKSRIDNIQAAILNVKMRYLSTILERRGDIADHYDEAFKDLPLGVHPRGEGEIVQEYVVHVKDRGKFKEFMDKKGVELLIRDTTPNHKLKGLGLSHFKLPITETIANDAVRLPMYPELTNQEVAYIIKSVKEFYGR